jgi:hypothetical protein
MTIKQMTTEELQSRYELALAQRKQAYKLRVGRDFIQEVNRQIRTFGYELAERGVAA